MSKVGRKKEIAMCTKKDSDVVYAPPSKRGSHSELARLQAKEDIRAIDYAATHADDQDEWCEWCGHRMHLCECNICKKCTNNIHECCCDD